MSNYSNNELRQLAIDHADALCQHLAGDWHRTEALRTEASIARGDCELYLWGYEQNGTARLSIQAQLPEGWGDVEDATPPEITVRTDRTIESIAVDIARRLLPAYAEQAARVHAALEHEQRRQAVSGSIIDHFLERMPGAVPDPHRPGMAVSSAGPAPFSASLLVRHDMATADLHLRDAPIELVRGLVDLAARLLGSGPEPESQRDRALDALADAITALASARHGIPLDRLLRETALNVLILGRIASSLVGAPEDRERLEHRTDQLVTALRHLAWQRPTDGSAGDQASTS